MSSLGRILRAAEALKAPSVVVAVRLCTHRHHQASSCSLCVDACPTQSVTVSAEGPIVDTLSCVDCGACVSICPTGALAAVRPTDQALAEHIGTAAESQGRVTVACAQATDGSGAVTVGCLARLDPSLLLTAFARGAATVTLCTGACDTCSVKEAATRVASVAADARRILDLFGLPGQIRVEERRERLAPGDAEEHSEPAGAGERSRPGRLRSTAVTRRGFFDILRHGGTYAAASAVGVLTGQVDTVIDEGPRRELLSRVPTKRERLLDALRTLVPETSARWEVDGLFEAPDLDRERCDRCGLCGRLCPTGALTLAEDEAGDLLSVTCRPDACVACGLCAEVCGRRALTLAPVPAGRVLAREPEPVTLVERGRCDAEPAHGAFEDEIRVSLEDKMQALLGVPVHRS